MPGRIAERFPRLGQLRVAGGFSADAFAGWVRAPWPQLKVQVIKRSDQGCGIAVLPCRRVVERTLGWRMRHRRFVHNPERTQSSADAWIHLVGLRLPLRCFASAETHDKGVSEPLSALPTKPARPRESWKAARPVSAPAVGSSTRRVQPRGARAPLPAHLPARDRTNSGPPQGLGLPLCLLRETALRPSGSHRPWQQPQDSAALRDLGTGW